MILGSPMSSPIQSPGSPGASSTYLPSFLLGDTTTPPKINVMNIQENPRHLNITNSSVMSSVSFTTPDYRSNRQKAVFGNTTTPSTPQMSPKNHTGGPPTRGLFDTLESSPLSSPYASTAKPTTSTAAAAAAAVSPGQSKHMMSTVSSPLMFPNSSLTMSTSESQSLQQWVTVFGFLPSDIKAVFAFMSTRVRIVDKHLGPQPQSNWIHLKCASEQEAQRALACNGSIISGWTMIGVVPCTDESVILGSDKENRTKLNGSMRQFPSLLKTPVSPCQSPFNLSPTSKRRKLRSLAGGQPFSPQTTQSPENAPQKSTGLVSKAMEYVFGW